MCFTPVSFKRFHMHVICFFFFYKAKTCSQCALCVQNSNNFNMHTKQDLMHSPQSLGLLLAAVFYGEQGCIKAKMYLFQLTTVTILYVLRV